MAAPAGILSAITRNKMPADSFFPNAVLMRTSLELELFAPDILGHQIGGIKVSQYKPPIGIASQHRSPTCYLHEGPPGNYSSVRWTVG